MNLRRTLMLFALASCAWLGTAQAGVSGFHIGLTPYVGYADWDEQEGPVAENAIVYGGRLAIFFNSWLGVEGHYGMSPAETVGPFANDLDIYPYGADLIINLAPHARVVPYVVAGWTEIKVDYSTTLPGGDDSATRNGWEVGGGLKWMFNERIGLRTEFRDMMLDRIPDASNDDLRHNFIYTAGLQFDLFGHVPDADKDGIIDRKDKCPATPMGATVAKDGCPTDGDGDGVFDGIDQCPGTPAGAKVDAKGCPTDSDGDGIADGLDQCADTPTGCRVDANGCPIDSDGDGVCDGKDQCADTGAGCIVDANGCPTDSDGDGVCDGKDLCPNTPAGTQVDANGCTAMQTQILDTGLLRISNITFATGKATLLPASHATLDAVGEALKNWPDLKVEIGGHTDSSGSDALNQKLSQARAQSVLDYLKGKFPTLNASQYTVVGYGETQPIGDNKTAEGKAMNRRVEFKVLNTDVLKKQVPKK